MPLLSCHLCVMDRKECNPRLAAPLVPVRHVSFAATQDELPRPPTSPVSSVGSNTPVPDGNGSLLMCTSMMASTRLAKI